ncbi:hypothetical protein F443_01960 [Phytophthora nicotianae P1569]|uniref:Uncharacterized protein n=2 Tax=Phytophthora nicotianae TaxID=4792 RepID=V9FY35_PHYNI|nr:hypothetical protein F443_01960 [Phytophthora nicotianae P1569]
MTSRVGSRQRRARKRRVEDQLEYKKAELLRARFELTTYCITDVQDTFTDDSSTDKLIETTADMNLQVELA